MEEKEIKKKDKKIKEEEEGEHRNKGREKKMKRKTNREVGGKGGRGWKAETRGRGRERIEGEGKGEETYKDGGDVGKKRGGGGGTGGEVKGEKAREEEAQGERFVTLEAEDLPEVSEKYKISAVPTFIFLKNKTEVDRLDGANAADLTKKVKHHSSPTSIGPSQPIAPKEDLNVRLKRLIESAPVILFMKGNPEEPRCGFSRTMVSILKENTSSTRRLIFLRMKKFVKGNREDPRCKFSKQVIQIMSETTVKYNTFDILSNEEVRQGLKAFSNWPTYPQLYVSGELIGGLDIIKEMKESGELANVLKPK
ncbi:hypothetical protein ScPMuIL_001138 [Solemya velum]